MYRSKWVYNEIIKYLPRITKLIYEKRPRKPKLFINCWKNRDGKIKWVKTYSANACLLRNKICNMSLQIYVITAEYI